MLQLLAFDYGASSGRAILGKYDGKQLLLDEIHRFSNDPVIVNGTVHWDILRLFYEMKQGISKCCKMNNGGVAGIGVDTWGVDFGLLGLKGELLGNPVHYRDKRTDGIMEETFKLIPKREIYQQTGTQFIQINTLYQLLAMKKENSQILDRAGSLLMIPDLFNYFLTGEITSELTVASTTQMLDLRNREWAGDLLRKLEIPLDILPNIILPGMVIGNLNRGICEELSIKSVPVAAVASHDTASALMSVASSEGTYAYLSSGTWSLLGIELSEPIINDASYALDFTNECGYGKTTTLHKNLMGLWLLQECKRVWDKEGDPLSYDQLENDAMNATPFAAHIDTDDGIFFAHGNMPDKIRDFCRRTGQKPPDNKASIVRCIIESLAFKYHMVLNSLEEIVGNRISFLHIVGGGCKNKMLCRFTANAIGRPVIAGPVEATAIGNLMCQMLALGEIGSLDEARQMVSRSFPTTEYLPAGTDDWDDAFSEFKKICIG